MSTPLIVTFCDSTISIGALVVEGGVGRSVIELLLGYEIVEVTNTLGAIVVVADVDVVVGITVIAS